MTRRNFLNQRSRSSRKMSRRRRRWELKIGKHHHYGKPVHCKYACQPLRKRIQINRTLIRLKSEIILVDTEINLLENSKKWVLDMATKHIFGDRNSFYNSTTIALGEQVFMRNSQASKSHWKRQSKSEINFRKSACLHGVPHVPDLRCNSAVGGSTQQSWTERHI